MPGSSQFETDVAVAGGGMGGLVAALAAAELDCRVTVFEKSDRIGGNANYSAGMLLGSSDFEGMRAYIPDGDETLQRVLCDELAPSIKWLSEHGLPIGEPVEFGDFRIIRPMGVGSPGRREEFMQILADRCRARGVDIRLGAPVHALARNGKGFAVQAEGISGNYRTVVVATGGFQANCDLLAKEIGREAANNLRLRTIEECNGDGLLMAYALGAATKGNMGAFYGHSMADAEVDLADLQPTTPYFARNSVLVNCEGRRFTDESASLMEETNAQAGCRQPGGVYFIVFDEHMLNPPAAAGAPRQASVSHDWLEKAHQVGFPVVSAGSLPELADKLAKEGVPKEALLEELAHYNDALAAKGTTLDPPRAANRFRLAHPPFHAVRCVAGITATTGGIATDSDGRVLDARSRPIAGLFAAGVDAGGVFGRRYGGFLTWALVSGRRCGASAVAYCRA